MTAGQASEPDMDALTGLTDMAAGFTRAGCFVSLPAPGILQIIPAGSHALRRSLLLSVGIHGDETAPIELLQALLVRLMQTPLEIKVNLMIVFGNLAAIAAGKRYIECDMNRLFERQPSQAGGAEGQRAELIMHATSAFFSLPALDRWHLDLHTAIRASRFPTFAIVPDVLSQAEQQELLSWLGYAGFEASILTQSLAATFSAFSARECGACSCTAEMGQVAQLGQNDLTLFSATQAALLSLLRGSNWETYSRPQLFSVAQELIKRSASFSLNFSVETQNFTAFAPGELIAQDGAYVYRVGAQTEYVVFPNPDVEIGKRAALMVRSIH